jgi:hypothetical protein
MDEELESWQRRQQTKMAADFIETALGNKKYNYIVLLAEKEGEINQHTASLVTDMETPQIMLAMLSFMQERIKEMKESNDEKN